MTVVIKDANGSFRDKALGWAGCPIDTTGLEVAHFFGGALDKSLRNFSYGKAISSAMGNPVVNPNSLSLAGQVDYVQSAMADTNETTLLVAFRPLEAVNAIVAGNLVATTNGTTRKLAITLNTSLSVAAFRGTDITATGAVLPTLLTLNTPVCLALRNSIGASAKLTLNNMTKGEVVETTNAGVPSLGSPIRIGSGYTASNYPGKTEVYAFVAFSRKVSDAELATLYAWLKAYCARRSIVI
jgi:hypothetical protein